MPRTKKTRDPRGSILEKQAVVNGKTRTVWDVRKRFPVVGPDGRKTYRDRTRRCYSKSEAAAALANLPQEIETMLAAERQTAKKAAGHGATFRDLAERFEASEIVPAVFVEGRKITGYKQKLSHLRHIVRMAAEHFGDRRLDGITFEDLRAYQVALAGRRTVRGGPPKAATVNIWMSQLRRLFSYAVEIGWLNDSPFRRGKLFLDRGPEASRNRMLTFDEERRLLAACEGVVTVTYERAYRRNSAHRGKQTVSAVKRARREHLIPLIVCALDTALRRGEIFGLEWRQVDLENGVIHLTAPEDLRRTKTGVRGVIPISSRLARILRDRYDGQRPEEKVFGRTDIKRSFASACRDAGIEDLQFRDLRSTAATRMVLAGNPESQVMKITRHTEFETFLKHYSNVDIANARAVAQRLDSFLERGGE